MKRIVIFAALASLATPLGLALADPDVTPGELGQPGPQQNVVAPEQPRGALGGLASGAPSFSADLKTIGSPAIAGAAEAAPAAAPAAVAPAAAATTTTTASQAVVVEKQAITAVSDHRQVRRILHHCLLGTLRNDGLLPPFGIPALPPFGHVPPPFGDLELQSVGMVSDAADKAGPIYRITFRNNSPLPVYHLRVSVIAVLGELNRTSPVATAIVEEVDANEIAHIDIQLPVGVMTLGPQGQPGPFESLIAVIDSFDELAETSELNNVLVQSRIGIAVVETATTTTTTAVAPAAAAVPVAPAAGAPAAAAPAPGAAAPAPAAPAEAAPGPAAAPADAGAAPAPGAAAPAQPAPSGNDALSSLDLDEVEQTSGLFSR